MNKFLSVLALNISLGNIALANPVLIDRDVTRPVEIDVTSKVASVLALFPLLFFTIMKILAVPTLVFLIIYIATKKFKKTTIVFGIIFAIVVVLFIFAKISEVMFSYMA